MSKLLAGPILAIAAMVTMTAATTPAQAVVYCTGVGIPVGCVVRPVAPVARGAAAAAVVTPGVGAPGVGVRPGTPMNRGGPVNRVGRR